MAVAPDPVPGPGELLVAVKATALNRADLLQRIGKYKPPPGASHILGLEMAGVVERVGDGEIGWKPGDRVSALLPGGGYAEKAVIPAGMAMRIPDRLSFEEAAAIPEVFLTAYLNLFVLGELTAGETALIHAGGRWVVIGGLGGQTVERFNLAAFLGKRIRLQFSPCVRCRCRTKSGSQSSSSALLGIGSTAEHLRPSSIGFIRGRRRKKRMRT